MRKFKFDEKKYGHELTMDLHSLKGRSANYFEPKVHTTDFFEIMFLKNSKGHININGFDTSLKPYTILCNSPNQKKTNAISSAQGYHLVFKDDFLANFFSDKLFVYKLHFFYNAVLPQFFEMDKDEYNTITYSLELITKEIESFREDSRHIIRSLLYFVLTKLNRQYADFYDIQLSSFADSIAYSFKNILEENIRNLHLVSDYTNLLNIERNKLNILVKKQFGVTSKELIQQRLILEIKNELLFTTKTISEISLDLNFSEPNNLSRFFQRLSGISPLEYRMNSKKI
ncbi:helix-turn-helix domain-containing protein [Aureibaculum luteum]|uniref:helix-turn-helix domain-containing protein n=1 Tax=Aureibaculum luteum TaxID=1548456 RepID=UPI000E4B1EA1|nr:AraC family transcriptional regulator [Aureibaculum luteum]